MGSRTRTDAVIAGVGVFLSAVVLPVVTNVMSDQVPGSWRPYLWISIPAGILLTLGLIVITRRLGDGGGNGSTQINTASGDGTVFASQHGDVRVAGDRRGDH